MLFAILALAAQTAAEPLDCGKAAPAFMNAYAADLAKGDRQAIAARYSARGAYSLGFDAKIHEDFDTIGKRYASPAWQKPDSFAWLDLSYEQLAPDTCLVVGGFSWTAGSRTAQMAYTAILRRENTQLRLTLEHENPLAPPPGQK